MNIAPLPTAIPAKTGLLQHDASLPALARNAVIQATALDEAALVKRLLNGQATASMPTLATPEGYHYIPRARQSSQLHTAPSGDILFLSPHPSDVSGDFFPLLICKLQGLGNTCRQLLLTRGEKGDDRYPEPVTIYIRQQEEAEAALITGINTEYLTRKDGQFGLWDNAAYFPDGELMSHLPALTERLKQLITTKKPRILALPALYPDHPDHLATAIAALNAIMQLREEGFFLEHGEIDILTSDPEFAVALGQPYAVSQIPQAFGGSKAAEALPTELSHFTYRYALDAHTGLVTPADDICDTTQGFTFAEHPMAVPPIIITAPQSTMRSKLQALYTHRTQMHAGKDYTALIPMVDKLRAVQLGQADDIPHAEWATGIYPIQIPGVTRTQHSILDQLPDNTVYQLAKKETTHHHATMAM